MGKTIIISNRLPLQIEVNSTITKITPSVGGLATGMKSVHDKGNSLWIGWSGIDDSTLSLKQQKDLAHAIHKAGCAEVSLTQSEVNDFYLGISNKAIWPLFHYFLEYCEYNKPHWEVYRQVNQKFCDVILEHYEPGDFIWVHDYQLLLLPKILREKLPDATIGFFLHIPFPSFEIFRVFPWREELLEGMLGANLIGFHTYDYERHFLSSVKRLLRLDVKYNEISYNGKIVKVDSFPMGIDYNKFHQAAIEHDQQEETEKSDLQKKLDEHIKSSVNSKLILSIDRLDYTKGVVNRIKAFELFLETYPAYLEKVRLIMLAVPSRSSVPQYIKLKRETDEIVGRINGKFATVNWTPIWYFYRSVPFNNIIDLYTSSDVAMITPIRDGMNLVAKEYIAARSKQDGVLILSEMTGAAKELNDALLVNPSNLNQLANSLKLAIEMPLAEQKFRNKNLQNRIKRYSVDKWANSFMNALQTISDNIPDQETIKIGHTEKNIIKKAFDHAAQRLLFIDYDGTLRKFHENPEMAIPDESIYSILDALHAIPNTTVVLISGRDKETLGKWFKDKKYPLVAEHGIHWRDSEGIWTQTENQRNDWMEHILPVMENFVDHTPGTFIEQKSASIAWHYRKTDPELGENRAVEMNTLLNSFISDSIKIMNGNKVIEVVSNRMHKGVAANRIFNKGSYDFVLAIGDDITDENMFVDLPKETWSIKVGFIKTEAKYCLANTSEVHALLSFLANV